MKTHKPTKARALMAGLRVGLGLTGMLLLCGAAYNSAAALSPRLKTQPFMAERTEILSRDLKPLFKRRVEIVQSEAKGKVTERLNHRYGMSRNLYASA